MNEKETNKPIEMPSRGRPRKKDSIPNYMFQNDSYRPNTEYGNQSTGDMGWEDMMVRRMRPYNMKEEQANSEKFRLIGDIFASRSKDTTSQEGSYSVNKDALSEGTIDNYTKSNMEYIDAENRYRQTTSLNKEDNDKLDTDTNINNSKYDQINTNRNVYDYKMNNKGMAYEEQNMDNIYKYNRNDNDIFNHRMASQGQYNPAYGIQHMHNSGVNTQNVYKGFMNNTPPAESYMAKNTTPKNIFDMQPDNNNLFKDNNNLFKDNNNLFKDNNNLFKDNNNLFKSNGFDIGGSSQNKYVDRFNFLGTSNKNVNSNYITEYLDYESADEPIIQRRPINPPMDNLDQGYYMSREPQYIPQDNRNFSRYSKEPNYIDHKYHARSESPYGQQAMFFDSKPQFSQPSSPHDIYRSTLVDFDGTGPENDPFDNHWFYKKKRKGNPILWHYVKNAGLNYQSLMHPSKLSSLNYIQGNDLQKSRQVFMEKDCNNSILPLFLNSNKELNDEYKQVIQNFERKMTEIDFSNVTVHQLKMFMKDFGLNHTGKKNELIDRAKSTLMKISQIATNRHTEDKTRYISDDTKIDDFESCFF